MTQWGIDTLFNPGKRHMDEEKQRLQSTREEVGDASGGRRIDLESGTVTISRKGKAAPAAESEDATESDEVGQDSEDAAPQPADETDESTGEPRETETADDASEPQR
jgi:hypothetical protein